MAALAAAYSRVGRTPGEMIVYVKHRLQGHGQLERLATPALDGLRDWLGEPSEVDLAVPFVVPPLPPNPAARRDPAPPGPGAAAPAAAVRDPAGRRILHVGPRRAITRVAVAAQVAEDGDIVEIDPGDYVADVAVWDRAEIMIRGTGERVRLIAAGADAEGKAIWVIRRGKVTVENIDFIGARVADRNGAGIRFESGHLVVRHCLFYDNENGIITGNDGDSILEIENSEFGYNGAGDGQSHNIYVGRIRSLRISGSYLHHANVGHLLKSRAQASRVEYSRLSDETGGRASYELEFPNGGRAAVIGNIIQQGRETRNSVVISYGTEAYAWPQNRLDLVHNTVVNDQPLGGSFVRVAPGAGAVLTRNNLFVGKGRVDVPEGTDAAGDRQVDWSYFVRAAREDYRPSDKARLAWAGEALAPVAGELIPRFEYRHPAQTGRLTGAPIYPGAQQSRGP